MTFPQSALLLRSQSDERLVTLARAGHEQAFVAIVERYRRPLSAYARRLVPESRSEDIVQQALISAWSALRADAEVHNLRGWLYRIVHNAGLSALGKRDDEHQELSESLVGSHSPETDVERGLQARQALSGVAALPARQRDALVLTALQGRRGDEVAGTLGIQEAAVRQLVRRARATLRAGATAITPLPLVTWAASATSSQPTLARISELSAGAGVTATAAKIGATVVAAGALAAGAVHLAPGGGHQVAPHPTRSHPIPAAVALAAAPESGPGDGVTARATGPGHSARSAGRTRRTHARNDQSQQEGASGSQDQSTGQQGGFAEVNDPAANQSGAQGETSAIQDPAGGQGATSSAPGQSYEQGPSGG